MYSFDEIRAVDPEIASAIESEMARQNSHIELIASENWVSKAVMAAMEALSPINTRKAIRARDITADANVLTLWKILQESVPRSFSDVTM